MSTEVACPWCATPSSFGEVVCRGCGKALRTTNNTIEWLDSAAHSPRRSIVRLALRQFHPLSSRVSPLRLLSDYRVEQYYQRTLIDSALASRWGEHYLQGLNLPTGSKVLDHGCGRGRNVAILRNLGYVVSGQDVARHAWWDKCPDALFQIVPGGAARLPWRCETFSCVFDVEVLHYLPDSRLAELAAEVFRVLQPGGYWVIIEANDQGYGAFLPRRLMGRLHALSRVRQVLDAAGFDLLDCGYEGFYAPVAPRLVNFLRKQLRPGPFDLADFDSSIAAAIAPERRALWRLRLQRPL